MAIPRIGTKFARGVKAGFAPAISERFRRREGRDQFKIREAAADRDLLRQIKALKARSRASFNLTKDVAGFKEGQVLEAFATPGSKGKRAKLLGAGIDPVKAGFLSPGQLSIQKLNKEIQEGRISLLDAQKLLAEARAGEVGADRTDDTVRNLIGLLGATRGGQTQKPIGHETFEFTDEFGEPATKVVPRFGVIPPDPSRKNIMSRLQGLLGVKSPAPAPVAAPTKSETADIPQAYAKAFGQLVGVARTALADIKEGKRTASVAMMQNVIRMATEGNKGANAIIDLLIKKGILKLNNAGSQQ